MKFLPLVWRSLWRRKIRTIFTILSIFVAFLLFGLLMTIRAAFSLGVELAGLDRLMVIHKVSIIQPLPVAYQNRLRSAEADVSSAEAALVNAQGTEARQTKLLKDGWTPKATYDTALQNLQAAEARLKAAKANLDLTRDQLTYTTLKADFDGVIIAVGAEAGQNVNAGQMVVKLARPDERDGVFNIAETAFADVSEAHPEVVVWPLSNPNLNLEGVVREISPVADPVTRTYTVKVTLKNPPPQLRFGMSIGGRLKGKPALAVALPLSALFEKSGSPAVWVLDHQSSSLTLRPITVARYEANTVVVASGLIKGDIVVTAGVNTLTAGQKVRLAEANLARSDSQ